MMFKWRPELEAMCPPRRGQGKPIVAKPVSGKKLFASTSQENHPRTSIGALLATGDADPEHRIADEADAYLLACANNPQKTGPAAVDRWMQLYGARDAVEIFCTVGKWKPSEHWADGLARAVAAHRLREWLAHAPDYDVALRWMIANKGLPGGMPHWKPNDKTQFNTAVEVVAFLFPDHRPFVEAAIKSIVTHDWTSMYVLGAISTKAELEQLTFGRVGYPDWSWNAVAFARALQGDALAPLIRYSKEGVLGVAHALTAFTSKEAAEGLALYLGKKKALPILEAYFKANPKLKTVLAPMAKDKKKAVREAVAKLL